MNTHFQPVEKKSQLFSYALAAFAAFTVLMLALSFSRYTEIHVSVPSTSMQVLRTENSSAPVAFPVPTPPTARPQATATLVPFDHSQTVSAPEAIPAPSPSVP